MNIPNLLRTIASCILIFRADEALHAQGTITFGFEQNNLGETPQYFVGLPGRERPVVADAVSYGAIPFEGSRILTALGDFQIASPDGFKISEASLALYVRQQRGVPSIRVSLGATTIDVTEFETWIPVRGVNHIFLERFEVSGIYQDIGEFWPARIAVDNVAITSIPEPRALAILIGASLLFVPVHLQKRRRRAQNNRNGGAHIAIRKPSDPHGHRRRLTIDPLSPRAA